MPTPERRQPDTPSHTWQVLWVGGDVDVATVGSLRQLLLTACDPQRDVILELSDVTFMDCSGLGVLLEARRRLGEHFWLSGVRPPVQRLLNFTGLSHRFAVLADPVRPDWTSQPDDRAGERGENGAERQENPVRLLPRPAQRAHH